MTPKLALAYNQCGESGGISRITLSKSMLNSFEARTILPKNTPGAG